MSKDTSPRSGPVRRTSVSPPRGLRGGQGVPRGWGHAFPRPGRLWGTKVPTDTHTHSLPLCRYLGVDLVSSDAASVVTDGTLLFVGVDQKCRSEEGVGDMSPHTRDRDRVERGGRTRWEVVTESVSPTVSTPGLPWDVSVRGITRGRGRDVPSGPDTTTLLVRVSTSSRRGGE